MPWPVHDYKTLKRAIAAPIISNLSGIILSICQPHKNAMKINIPPYAA